LNTEYKLLTTLESVPTRGTAKNVVELWLTISAVMAWVNCKFLL